MINKPVVKKMRIISPVWIVPITAIIIAVWLAVQAQLEKGTEIEITLRNASDVMAGQTLIKLKDVEVGRVNKVTLSDDLKSVTLKANIDRHVSRHLSKNTRFWVVTPRISAAGVSNLGTLISGVHILMDPGEKDGYATRFVGLDAQPILKSDEPGTSYIVESEALNSLDIGSPIYFRQIRVGEVTGYNLSEDAQSVDINIFIRAPHDRMVQTRTRFWNVSGFGVSIGADGMKAKLASLASLINGGIEFDNATGFTADNVADDGKRFYLHPDRESVLEGRFNIKYFYLMKFSGNVRGLNVGAPVEFKGIKVGEVVDVLLDSADNTEGNLHVYIAMEPQRFNPEESPSKEEVDQRMSDLVAQGLHGQMKVGSIVTGSKYIDLIFTDTPEPDAFVQVDNYSIIPTVIDSTDQLMAQVNNVLTQVNDIPIAKIGKDLSASLASLNSMLATLEKQGTAKKVDAAVGDLGNTLKTANDALAQISQTMLSLDQTIAPDSELKHELTGMLKSLSDAADSVELFMDELTRHPNALLSGAKKDD